MTSILDLILCWSGSWNPRIYSLLLIYYKGCFKGYKWTARWKHTGRGLDGLHTQEGYPMELGCAILPIHRCVHQPRNSPNLTLFMTASSCRRDWLLTQFPAPLTSLENGDLGLKVPNFSPWLGHSGNHPPSRSPPRVAFALPEQMILLSHRTFQGIYNTNSVANTIAQEHYIRKWGQDKKQELGGREWHVFLILHMVSLYFNFFPQKKQSEILTEIVLNL